MRRTAFLVAVVVGLSAFVPPVLVGSASPVGSDLSVSEVAITPTPAEPGQSFTVSVTVRDRSEEGPSYRIRTVRLLNDTDAGNPLDSTGVPGILDGGSKEIDLQGSFSTTGVYPLRVRVVAEASDGERVVLVRQFEVRVGGDHPRISVNASRLYAGVPASVQVRVANGLDSPIRSVEVGVKSDGFDVLREPHVRARIGAGEEATFSIRGVASASGNVEATTVVRYVDSNGERRTIRQPAAFRVAPRDAMPTPKLQVDVANPYVRTESIVRIRVANGLESAVRNLAVSISNTSLEVLTGRQVRPTLASGETGTFAFRVRAAEPGRRTLVATLSYTDAFGVRHTVRRDASVRYEPRSARPAPLIAVNAANPVAGAETTLNVTVTNGQESAIRNLVLQVSGGSVEDGGRETRSVIESGESATLPVPVLVTEPGRRNLTTTLSYTVNGDDRTLRAHSVVVFEPLVNRVQLRTSRVSGRAAVRVEVLNLGNVPIEDVLIRGRAPNATASPVVLDRVRSGASRIVRLNVTRVTAPGTVPLRVRANYSIGGRREAAETSFELAANPGTIELTGVEVQESDTSGRVQISGSASNVGLTDARSVLLEVVDTENVTPAPPQREYFVGTVPASDFLSFDLNARITGSVSHIPVRITYLVDGERREHVTTIPYVGSSSGENAVDSNSSSGGSSFLTGVVGGMIVVGIGGIIYVGWRNSRD